MTTDQWAEAKKQLMQLLEVTTGPRQRLLRELAIARPQLEPEVRQLLEHHSASDDFLEEPLDVEWIYKADEDAVDALANLAGERIGPYRLMDEIGRGGMGIVYRAERDDGVVSMEVAIKMVALPVAEEGLRRRFLLERQILASADHPYIARLLDAGTRDDGTPYVIMEYVSGTPIDQYCDERRLSIRERLVLFLKVCQSVEFSHSLGVLHLDIKPGNILVKADGTPKLLDFGIARLVDPGGSDSGTGGGVRRGSSGSLATTGVGGFTPWYASPEQLAGSDVDARSDVFSLGILLYTLLTGVHPFAHQAPSFAGVGDRLAGRLSVMPSEAIGVVRVGDRTAGRLDKAVIRLRCLNRCNDLNNLKNTLLGQLDGIAMRAIRHGAPKRFPTVRQFGRAVANFVDVSRGDRVEAPTWPRRALWVRVRPSLIGAAIALLFVLIVLATTTFSNGIAG